MTDSIDNKIPSDSNKNEKSSVRAVVLIGVFWRILIIEGILLLEPSYTRL